jgi:hypothetical protein
MDPNSPNSPDDLLAIIIGGPHDGARITAGGRIKNRAGETTRIIWPVEIFLPHIDELECYRREGETPVYRYVDPKAAPMHQPVEA